MYPSVTDILRDLFGLNLALPIQTFGFFVAIAFLCGSYVLGKELKRMEGLGWMNSLTERMLIGKPASTQELVIAAVVGFLIGFKLIYGALHYGELVDDPQGVIMSAKGSWLGGLLGAALSAWSKKREKDKEKLAKPEWRNVEIHPYDLVGNLTLIAAAGGLIGAKIFHILEDTTDFMRDPIGALTSFSGLTFYGGLIVGAASVLWYARKKGIPLLRLMDATAPALMLAYGVGRIGCQMAGDGDWGIVNTHPMPDWMSFLPEWMWAFDYPHNVNGVGIPIPGCEGKHCAVLPETVYPTPFYESVMGIGLFGFLWSIRKKLLMPGMMFCIYLVVNGLERFFIEKIRVNATYDILGHAITQAEIISAALVLVGITGIWLIRKRGAVSSTSDQ
ncbi:MAG: prolipoprotein diacylglyceryl transferase [Flavobacteriales bacterium]|nr:prolipoprotein diacylglyceryl transferase [Flavobacteriales bacterium]